MGSDGNSSEDLDEDDYYMDNTDDLDLDCPSMADDPEYFEYEPLQLIDAERMLNEQIETLCTKLKVSPTLPVILSYNF